MTFKICKLDDWETTQAEEGFQFEVQYAISALMSDKGVSQSALAEALGCSRANVSQMLNDPGRNLSTRLIGRIFAFLGETEVTLSSRGLDVMRTKLRAEAIRDVPMQDNFCALASKRVVSMGEARACVARQHRSLGFELDDNGAPTSQDLAEYVEAMG